LLDKEKKIIGRGLDVKALAELLAAKNAERDRTRELIETFFAPLAGDTLQIYNGIDMFYNSSKGDTGMMKEFMQELYNTLGRSEDYTLQQGAVYVAKKYMLGMPDFWSAEFLEKRKEDVRIFNMNRLGSVAADLDLERADGSSLGLFDVTTDYKVLYFYRPNCGVCAEVTPKMAAIYNEFKEKIDIEIFAINLGKGYEEWINYFSTIGADWENVRGTDGDSSEIYRRYHLQNIPAIYLLKGNVVVAKNINDNELKNILNNITQ
ncbi:MAG: thioredoxin family protein, partial [Bacteroidales bacterium]|nr:thioredoxin family protein [Bacteroidales bacterium]